MGRPTMLRAKSIAALMPTVTTQKMTNFLFHNTSLHKMRRRRRNVVKDDSCRTLNGADLTEESTSGAAWEEQQQQQQAEDGTFQPNENMTLLQAKGLMATLERELSKQLKAKEAVLQLCHEDLSVAQARRASGCRRGFLLSLNKMKKHQRDVATFAQAIECLETLLLVISTEVSQVQALAELSGQEPSDLKLFLSAESLRSEIQAILSDDYSSQFNAATWDDSEALFRELRTVIPIPVE